MTYRTIFTELFQSQWPNTTNPNKSQNLILGKCNPHAWEYTRCDPTCGRKKDFSAFQRYGFPCWHLDVR